jgi:dienelactone hydrolase
MRTDFEFQSEGSRCAAWFYRPERRPAPCVVMAHGFSAVREQRLDAYAERFAQAGFAALVFDYRHFGASAGEPRQLLDIQRQLQDWRAAIAFARGQEGVDAKRIALFGSSFSGGHVQWLAAHEPEIAAAIAQAPFVDGLRNLPALGIAQVLKLTAAGMRDALRALTGRAPYLVPAVGAPGSFAIITTPDAEEGFRKITPPGSTWRNEVCARIALQIGFYRPGQYAAQIRCPILFCIAAQDVLTPARLAFEAAERAPHGEAKSYPCGHFDVYLPPIFDQVVTDQIDFLRRHLG